MAVPSVFSGLDQAQLYYLKSQYLTSLQVVDQAESALQAQLDDVGKARKQLTDLMSELDQQMAKPVAPAALQRPDLPTAHRVPTEPGDPETPDEPLDPIGHAVEAQRLQQSPFLGD